MRLLVLALGALAHAGLLAIPQAGRDSCASIPLVINALKLLRPVNSFCSSYLGIRTQTITQTSITGTSVELTTVYSKTGTDTTTAAAVTITAEPTTRADFAAAVTETLPTATITAEPVIVPETVTSTVTACAEAAPRPAKRDAEAQFGLNLGGGIPLLLRPFTPKLSTGCSCLSTPTPTATSIARVEVTSINTITSNVAGSTTITPTETSTPIEVVTETPTVTESPSTTVTPTTTSTETSFETILVGQTATGGLIGERISGKGRNGDLPVDSSFLFNSPFPLTLYGYSTTRTIISTNGWLSLAVGTPAPNNAPSTLDRAYANVRLPSGLTGVRSRIPDIAFAVYWNDLDVALRTRQGVYYQIEGEEPRRNLTIEWVLSQRGDPNRVFQFWASFLESLPGVVTYNYFRLTRSVPVTDSVFGTVGVQRFPTNQFSQFAFDEAGAVYPGLEMT